MTMPLEGVRVLDLSRVLAGPFATMLLGDLGAEIIKIEEPGVGDETRSWGPPFISGESAYFMSINRNKKSMTLNLKHEKGKQIVLDIAKKSDVIIENFRPGVVERLGLDYESIRNVNPAVIYCSISGFGQTGPYRTRAAYDLILQGIGGFMGITGEQGRPPVRIGVAIADLAAGIHASFAITAAYISKLKTGLGQFIDISMLDCATSWMTYMAANYFASGKSPTRLGSQHPNIAPYQCFEAQGSKYINVAVANDSLWRNFCVAVGSPEFLVDQRFDTNAKRVENRSVLLAFLEDLFVTKTREEWLSILNNAGIPCGPVYTMEEIFHDPQVTHRGTVVTLDHPKAGKIKQLRNPSNSSISNADGWLPPPLLGQHTEEVLTYLLGFSPQEINEMKKARVI